MVGQPLPEIPKQEVNKPADTAPQKESRLPQRATVLAHKVIMDNPYVFGHASAEKQRQDPPLDFLTTGNIANDVVGFATAYFDKTPYYVNLRGSSTRKAARSMLMPSSFDPRSETLDEWEGRIARVPDTVVKGAVQQRFHDALTQLPPEMRAPYEHIFNTRQDMDIQINHDPSKPTDNTPEAFSEDFFTKFLPFLTNSLQTGEHIQRPATTLQEAQALGTSKTATEQSAGAPQPMVDEPDARIYVLDRQIALVNSSGQYNADNFPKTVVYARRIPIREGRLTVTQLFIGADRRTDPNEPFTLETIDTQMQPALSIQFNTTLSSAEEMAKYDSRTSLAGTSYDEIQADLGITTDENNLHVRFRDIGQEENAPQTTITLDQARLKVFTEPLSLGPRWGQDRDQGGKKFRDPADDLEVATRALWQAIDAGVDEYYPKRQPTEYIAQETFDRIAKFVTAHPDLPQLLQTDAYSYQRGMIQDNLMTAMLMDPHRFLEYVQKSGLAQFVFPTMDSNAVRAMQEQLQAKLPADEYKASMYGSVMSHEQAGVLEMVILRPEQALQYLEQHPDLVPPRNFAEVIFGKNDPELRKQLEKVRPIQPYSKTLGPTGFELIHGLVFPDQPQDYTTVLKNLYNLTNIGYNQDYANTPS